MNLRFDAVVLLILFLTSPAASAAQQVTLASGATIDRQNDSGDYVITYRQGGELKKATLVPATKVSPSIRLTVLFQPDTGTFVYSYAISNGALAQQDVYSISFNMVGPVQVTGTPGGWNTIKTPSAGRLSWYNVPVFDRFGGIRPGDRLEGFAVRSPMLPGPTQVRVKGNVPVLEIPDKLPEDLLTKLDQMLVTRNYVTLPAITPSIPSGQNEPELTADVLMSRVVAAYYSPIERSKHEQREELLKGLSDAIATLGKDRLAGIAAIARLKKLAERTGSDTWAQSLGQGLGLALDVVSRFASAKGSQ